MHLLNAFLLIQKEVTCRIDFFLEHANLQLIRPDRPFHDLLLVDDVLLNSGESLKRTDHLLKLKRTECHGLDLLIFLYHFVVALVEKGLEVVSALGDLIENGLVFVSQGGLLA